MKVHDRTRDLESEVLKIRLLRSTKDHIKKVAKQEYRSFEKQCQIILDESAMNLEVFKYIRKNGLYRE